MIDKILKYLHTILDETQIREIDNAYILPTICHNESADDASPKLYLYKNEDTTPLFHCYTECGETFNVYQLVQKIYELQDKQISFQEAFKLINGESYTAQSKPKSTTALIAPVVFSNPTELRLPSYPEAVLDVFNHNNPTSHPWFLEGIDSEVLRHYEVFYSKSFEGVVIPHRDYLGRLVGVRIRTYNPTKEQFAKYMPLKVGEQLYSHPLSLNLFGLHQNEEFIRATKTAYLFEGEKSVLHATHMFKHALSLAVCGSSISQWQMQMLIHHLQIENLFVCFDKEYSTYAEKFAYFQKLSNMIKPLLNFMNVYIAIDDSELFDLKESPVDRTKKEFEQLNFRKA